MNKQNKVLLSTIGLLLLSGIAATSSTFAWFTTVRSASVNYGKATVGTTEGNLGIDYVRSLNTGLTEGGSDNALTLTGANAITDISGDGKNLYKPIWFNQTDSWTGTASEIRDVSAVADGNFIDFTIEVSRSNAFDETGMEVYLGANTAITAFSYGAGDTVNQNLVKATRLAVLDEEGEVILRWAPVAETSPKYLEANTSGTVYGKQFVKADDNTAIFKNGTLITTAGTRALADAAGFKVASLTSDAVEANAVTAAEITFRIWIEGEDAETTNAILGGVLNVAIDLYAHDII